MRKRLLLLGMIICLLALTACSGEEAHVMSDEEQQAISISDSYLSQIAQMAESGMADQYAAQYEELGPIFESWNSGMEELGMIASLDDHDVKFDGKKVIVTTEVTGALLDPKEQARKADIELIYNAKDGMIESFSINVRYTGGELMTKAALNTLLGMGTVFAVLILISLIISCFGFIPKIQAAFSKKQEAKAETAVDHTIAQIIEKEELSDDMELVAVISAAIAAYEAASGSVSADGVVIRSIRKVNKSKWQNA